MKHKNLKNLVHKKQKSFLMKIFIIGLIIASLLITGCISGGRSEVPDANYHSGTEGIYMDFISNTPPYKIYHGDPLDIMVEVTNRGATNVINGKLYISGYDPKYFQISPTETSFTIEGKSIYNPDGRLNQILTFTDSRVDIPGGADSIEQTIKLTSCYKYSTEAYASVCIDPNPRSVSEKVCTPGTISLGGGQGAPISVTSIEQEVGRDRATFKINFANVGGGTVFDTHKGLTNCHTSLEYMDIDVVDVRAKLSDKTLTCEPNRGMGVRIVNNQGFVYCYYAGNLGDDSYSTQITVEIDYAYRDSITKSVEIVNI